MITGHTRTLLGALVFLVDRTTGGTRALIAPQMVELASSMTAVRPESINQMTLELVLKAQADFAGL